MSKIALGMICNDCRKITRTLTSVIRDVSMIDWEDIVYNYKCIGFRLLDTETLEIGDYSVDDVVGSSDSISGLYSFSEEDINHNSVWLTLYGCTERYLAENCIKDGKLSKLDNILPIVLHKTSSSSIVRRVNECELKFQFVCIVESNNTHNSIYVDIYKKDLELVLLGSVVYRTNKFINIEDSAFKLISKPLSDRNRNTIIYRHSDLRHLYSYVCDYSVVFNDLSVTLLPHTKRSDNLILPNTVKKVILSAGAYSISNRWNNFEIVIPPSVSSITLKSKKYFKTTHIVLYIAKNDKYVKLVQSIALQLDKSISKLLAIAGSSISDKAMNKIIDSIRDGYNIEIRVY